MEAYQGPGLALPRYRLVDGRLVTIPYPAPRWWQRLRLVEGINFVRWRSTDATFALNEAILKRFVALAQMRGVVPVIAFLPAESDGRDDRRRRRWLAERSTELGLAFLDLTSALHAPGVHGAYLPRDTHWSPVGHRVVAEALASFLAPLLRSSGVRLP